MKERVTFNKHRIFYTNYENEILNTYSLLHSLSDAKNFIWKTISLNWHSNILKCKHILKLNYKDCCR